MICGITKTIPFAKKMDTIIAPFLVRTQDYLRLADRDSFCKIHCKYNFLKHCNDCDCINQLIMQRTHLILEINFSEEVDESDWLPEIKSEMEWQMPSFVGAPCKKRRIMENPIVANIQSYLPQSSYEQLKWLYENACHIFRQQGWALDMAKLLDLDGPIDDLHDVYGPGAHMVLSVLFGDMDGSLVVQNLLVCFILFVSP